jgi:4'-phosphopantetheinyl transferase EntD
MTPFAKTDRELSAERALRALTLAVHAEAILVGARQLRTSDEEALHPEERRQIANATIVRRREFASGRALLRSLLGENVAIPIGDDRRPLLPPGVCACLAHDRNLAVAVLTREPHLSALGLDLEPVQRMTLSEAAVVLRDDERGVDPGLAFCLKEAAYKAWSSVGGHLLDHHDVHVRLHGGRFRASVLNNAMEMTGAWDLVDGAWIALVAVTPSGR